jgi:hypothetical protein
MIMKASVDIPKGPILRGKDEVTVVMSWVTFTPLDAKVQRSENTERTLV